MANESAETPQINTKDELELTPDFLRSVLKELRDDWKDEIPEKMLNSTDSDRNYKVRKAWFTGVCGYLDLLLETDDKIPSKLKNRIEGFNKRYQNVYFTRRRTRENDIRSANSIISELLGDKKDEKKTAGK